MHALRFGIQLCHRWNDLRLQLLLAKISYIKVRAAVGKDVDFVSDSLQDGEIHLRRQADFFSPCLGKDLAPRVDEHGMSRTLHRRLSADSILEVAAGRDDFSMSDEDFAAFASYHFSTCEKRELLGAANHLLYICQKQK